MNPGKQERQLLEEEQDRQPAVEFVVPHLKHYPSTVIVFPKEQERQINDFFLYEYLHFSHPVEHGKHSSDISRIRLGTT